MVQQKMELNLGSSGKDIQPPLLWPRCYGHIGQNTQPCPLTVTALACVWRSVARGEDMPWSGGLAAPPCGLLNPGSNESSQLPAGSQGI